MRLALHDWIHPEPLAATIALAARAGVDALELSAEPALHSADDVARLLDRHGVGCWGGVTRMFGGRDLVHPDPTVRRDGVAYVRDALRWVAALGGEILTVTPSAVGKTEPAASPATEWEWCVEALRACQEEAEAVGVRLALEPLNRFETHFLNRGDQAVALAEQVGGDCGVCLDLFHMNVEEASWRDAIAHAGDRLADVHVADNNRRPPGEGALDWDAVLGVLAGAGYDGCLTLEFVRPADRSPLAADEPPFEEAVRSGAAFLRARHAALAAAPGGRA